MRTKINSIITVIIFAAASIFIFLPNFSDDAAADTWTVPGDFPTIQIAIDASSDGDMIFVAQGIYTENLVIAKSISLVGENSETTTIDGQGAGHVIEISAGWVNISGFRIMHSTPNNGFDGIRSQNTWNSTFQGNILHGCSGAMVLENLTGSTIHGNVIHNNIHGIYISQPTSQQNNIDNNIIINHYNSSMWLDNVSNNSFQGNHIENATWAGLNMIASSNNTFTWN
ncbi:MAG: right-handed parallel beta-helix repeat-containing protein, partial [Thermoplasmata archaeon]|nr:right-handed parallel beta-helix repeat-containing protein [Thermoplasmata archaeon]